MTNLDSRLSDQDAQRVLARALELQAQGAEALTVVQVREIASDLAIPESAVDEALSEHRRAAAARSSGLAVSAGGRTLPEHRGRARALMLTMAVVGSAFALLIVAYVIGRLFP